MSRSSPAEAVDSRTLRADLRSFTFVPYLRVGRPVASHARICRSPSTTDTLDSERRQLRVAPLIADNRCRTLSPRVGSRAAPAALTPPSRSGAKELDRVLDQELTAPPLQLLQFLHRTLL